MNPSVGYTRAFNNLVQIFTYCLILSVNTTHSSEQKINLKCFTCADPFSLKNLSLHYMPGKVYSSYKMQLRKAFVCELLPGSSGKDSSPLHDAPVTHLSHYMWNHYLHRYCCARLWDPWSLRLFYPYLYLQYMWNWCLLNIY